jgi:hypothetical protein
MTMDELMAQVLEILPEAIFDEEMETGEIVISTGLMQKARSKNLVKIEEEE